MECKWHGADGWDYCFEGSIKHLIKARAMIKKERMFMTYRISETDAILVPCKSIRELLFDLSKKWKKLYENKK